MVCEELSLLAYRLYLSGEISTVELPKTGIELAGENVHNPKIDYYLTERYSYGKE